MIALLLALQVVAGPPAAWINCLEAKTAYLEASGDEPLDVAKAAVAECAAKEPASLGYTDKMALREAAAEKYATHVTVLRAARHHH